METLNWRYDMDLKVGEGTSVHFNDWMFLQEDGVLVNRARVTKLGSKSRRLPFLKSKAG